MKSFFKQFSDSAKELKSIKCLAVTGLFVAISMIIEGFAIDIGFAKLNFAFLAIAVIGMLFGPSVAFLAGLACDIVGYIAHPDGGFLPAYVLVAGVQGVIYGICLYRKFGRTDAKILCIRATAARLLDVIIINLIVNTALNMHYGFIPAESFGVAIASRTLKNVIELAADLPLLFLLLPLCLTAYKRTSTGRASVQPKAEI
ncbi:MAG: folate family ECF transporter S component [Ruminococcus sp.]|nr:folate family ECF transporter S component [Ruminococcus sp.]